MSDEIKKGRPAAVFGAVTLAFVLMLVSQCVSHGATQSVLIDTKTHKVAKPPVSGSYPDLDFTGLRVVPSFGVKVCGFDENGYGFVVSTGVKGYYTAHFSGTITKWSIIATGTGPVATIDVWKIASGTVLPTASNSIIGTGTKPFIVTGNAVPPTAVDWTNVTVNYGDILAFNVDSVTNATRIIFELEVDGNVILNQ